MTKKKVVVQRENIIAYGHGLPKEVFLTKDFGAYNHQGKENADSDTLNPANILGEANVYMEGIDIKADLKFFANVKNLGKRLWPAVGGRVLERNESGEIIKAEITEVSLCSTPNVDPNIPPVENLP